MEQHQMEQHRMEHQMSTGVAAQHQMERFGFNLRYQDVNRDNWLDFAFLQESFVSTCASSSAMQAGHQDGRLVYLHLRHRIQMLANSPSPIQVWRVSEYRLETTLKVLSAANGKLVLESHFSLLDTASTAPNSMMHVGSMQAILLCCARPDFRRHEIPRVLAEKASNGGYKMDRLDWPARDARVEDALCMQVQSWHEDALKHVKNSMYTRFLCEVLEKGQDFQPGEHARLDIEFRAQAKLGDSLRVLQLQQQQQQQEAADDTAFGAAVVDREGKTIVCCVAQLSRASLNSRF